MPNPLHLVDALHEAWCRPGWEAGRSGRPHPDFLDPVPLWTRPADRDDLAVVLLVHDAPHATLGKRALAMAAASGAAGTPRWVGCLHLLDPLHGRDALEQVARLGHALSLDLPGFLYRPVTLSQDTRITDVVQRASTAIACLIATVDGR